jgi:hypothetical protein
MRVSAPPAATLAGVVTIVVASVAGVPVRAGRDARAAAPDVAPAVARQFPLELDDQEFWRIVTDFSEPGGAFHSDNFTSNEPGFALAAAELAARRPGGAYLGVGPEQNFSYIAALRPEIAFIVDIRRQAVVQHLLFKALFELSEDRVDWLSRLFSVPRADVRAGATLESIWTSIPTGPDGDRERYLRNRAAVEAQLVKTRGFALTADDLASLDYVYSAFFTLGPAINYAGFQGQLSTGNMDFVKLSLATDGLGVRRSFLATEERFQLVKAMHARNLIVPVQGDFGGPRTLRAIGEYLRARGTRVNAFYISNVEQYLFGNSPARFKDVNGGWRSFYRNLGALPIDASSVLVRAASFAAPRAGRPTTSALCPIQPFLAAVTASRVTTLAQARQCIH